LNEHLRRIMVERNLVAGVAEQFRATTPVWSGLWITSPLRRPQCELLLKLFEPLAQDGDFRRGYDVEGVGGFVRALRVATAREVPLHVALYPPGHVDLGWYTIFAHCPRCKAEADVERWAPSVPSFPYTCKVCGYTFNPSQTRSSHPDPWDNDSLERLLGDDYAAFAYAYARHRGYADWLAAEAVGRAPG
jgi:hypothetical protein